MDADRIADETLVGGDGARLSPELREWLEAWEGVRLTPYLDVAGYWTVGCGHKMQATDPHAPITQDECDALLDTDLIYFAEGVSRLIIMPLPQYRFDALGAFGYNVGLGALAGSTLRKRVNGGYFAEAADEFLKWDIAGGKADPRLLKRRQAERAMFAFGDYSQRP